MKIYWSALLLFAALLSSCSKEQFGTAAQKNSSQVDPLRAVEQSSCTNYTLISPKVDILYVVDNSSSSGMIQSATKDVIKNTLKNIPQHYDYKIIGTPLIKTDYGDNDFKIIAKNPAPLLPQFQNYLVSNENEFDLFNREMISSNVEVGLTRVKEFITAHQSDGLFREDAYTIIILISNGSDTEIERVSSRFGNNEMTNDTAVYAQKIQALKTIKSYLRARQFRLFSVTPSTTCENAPWTSLNSYVKASRELYLDHNPALSDSPSQDHFNICGANSNLATIFSRVKDSIQEIVLKHHYQYWPITFTDSNGIDISKIRVYTHAEPSAPRVLMPNSQWTYESNSSGSTINTRTQPTPGEPTQAKHLVKFQPGFEVKTPECVTVTSESNLEFFDHIVLSKPAVQNDPANPIIVKINGQVIPTNAYTYRGFVQNQNIKTSFTYNGVTYSNSPTQIRTGYMIQITDSSYYYKSGDNVEVGFKPAPL